MEEEEDELYAANGTSTGPDQEPKAEGAGAVGEVKMEDEAEEGEEGEEEEEESVRKRPSHSRSLR